MTPPSHPKRDATYDRDNFLDELTHHRDARQKRLRSPEGWLSLVGRWILDPGANEIGVGTAFLDDDNSVRVVFRPESLATVNGERVVVHRWAPTDTGPEPRFVVDGRRYELLRQGDKTAIRARDPQSPFLAAFRGLDFYAPNEKLRVSAKLEKADPPRILPIPSGLGAEVQYDCPGTLVFSVDGQRCTLDPVIEDDAPNRLFIIFKDATNQDETYGGGRFLYAPLPDANGDVVIDFNQAYNPPCALTEFAACPVTPPQNRLALRIAAGEKRLHS